MSRVMFVVMLFLMCFQGAWAQLPPNIQADYHLMAARNFIKSENYDSAKKEFESILKLNVKVPNDFYFHYGKALIKGRDLESGKKMIEKFTSLTGRNSKLYKPAQELLLAAKNPPPESSEELKMRLRKEFLARRAVFNQEPDRPHSDTHTGKTFKADGKEWQVGQYNIDYRETRSWVRSLDGGWRIPTRVELRSLYNVVGKTSAIGSDSVWADVQDENISKAWGFHFFDRLEYPDCFDYRNFTLRAVAVR